MINFKSPSFSDFDGMKRFLYDDGEMTCEMNFLNIVIWKSVYENLYYMDDKTLFFKSGSEAGGTLFSLPLGDFDHGMEIIFAYCRENGIKPDLWTSYGQRFLKFREKWSGFYEVIPVRENFDYIYESAQLAGLPGKKYHSKRNHIAAFTKKHPWTYERISRENTAEVLTFAEDWYKEHAADEDRGMLAEHAALKEILQCPEAYAAKGALIRTEGRIAAFTLGSPINSSVFDIHYEKAAPDLAEAYSVINREFAARELSGYRYINREDDLGLEGLRKAKLSYKPAILLEKYVLSYKGEKL